MCRYLPSKEPTVAQLCSGTLPPPRPPLLDADWHLTVRLGPCIGLKCGPRLASQTAWSGYFPAALRITIRRGGKVVALNDGHAKHQHKMNPCHCGSMLLALLIYNHKLRFEHGSIWTRQLLNKKMNALSILPTIVEHQLHPPPHCPQYVDLLD